MTDDLGKPDKTSSNFTEELNMDLDELITEQHEFGAKIPFSSVVTQAEVHSNPKMAEEFNVEVENPAPNSAVSKIQALLPSPFKNSLIWPNETVKPMIPRRRREVLPSVVSSVAYRAYLKKKEDKKQEEENKKKERALMRERKRNEKEKLKQQKSEEAALKKKEKQSKKKVKPKPKRKVIVSSSDSEEEWQPTESDITEPDEPEEITSENATLGEDGYIFCTSQLAPQEENDPGEPGGRVDNSVESHEESDLHSLPLAIQAESIITDIEAALNSPVSSQVRKESPVLDLSEGKNDIYSTNCDSELIVEDNKEEFEITEGDYAIISVGANNELRRTVCKVENIDAQGFATVSPLVPYNRLKTVFKLSGERMVVQNDDIVAKLDTPSVFGNCRDKVSFPGSVNVEL